MLFNSYIFILFFLPVTIGGYFFINKYRKNETANTDLWWLFLMSLWFYGYTNPVYLILLFISIGANFFVSTRINDCRSKDMPVSAKGWMAAGVVFNLALLLYFKYFDFFISNVNVVFGTDWTLKNLILPLGISFFTFKQIAYVVDCYRMEEQVHYQWIEYAAYVSFFPQLISGPIGLHYEFVPKMREVSLKKINYTNMNQGLYAIAMGLAKKGLIADNLLKVVEAGLADIEHLSGASAWVLMLAYTLQLYFDFSGYSDVALGIEKMLNLEPVVNFNSPYKAKTVSEFWARWHMSLTRFFTRYVYIPLGGSRKGKVRTYLNTMIVFGLSGLWHGANWTFILWGFLHGLFMTVEKMIKDLWKAVNVRIENKMLLLLGKVAGFVYTFLFVNLAWILFRVTDLKQAELFVSRLFVNNWRISPSILEKVNDLVEIRVLIRFGLDGLVTAYPWLPCVIMMIGLLFAVFLMKNTQEKMVLEKYGVLRSILVTIVLVWSVISFADVAEFLYFNF